MVKVSHQKKKTAFIVPLNDINEINSNFYKYKPKAAVESEKGRM